MIARRGSCGPAGMQLQLQPGRAERSIRERGTDAGLLRLSGAAAGAARRGQIAGDEDGVSQAGRGAQCRGRNSLKVRWAQEHSGSCRHTRLQRTAMLHVSDAACSGMCCRGGKKG